MACIGFAFFIARLYGLRHSGLLKEGLNLKAYKKSVRFAFFFGFFFYVVSAALAWIHTYLSFLGYFLIAMYFVFSFATRKLLSMRLSDG